ncbi:MAG: hypothetical protein GC160_21745 [Acidobacteria bacterium]|nr:hypothetical protein [Acidobacteriota bacterium]
MKLFAAALLLLAPAVAGDLFVDAADSAGLGFRHVAGAEGRFRIPEIMGSGVGLLDYDGDGDLDVYFVQGAGSDRLFRSRLAEDGRLAFEDVTRRAGLLVETRPGESGHGMGVAAADVDNDGDIDLFVSRYGPDRLWLNQGDGTFREAGEGSGLGDPGFGASAAFFDFDADGLLDLFLTRYNGFTDAGAKQCRGPTGVLDYCSPLEYPPLPDRLYRNLGGGRFRDVSAQAGVDQAFGAGLGVAAADFNGDGRPDLYVANDKSPNQLWLNQGGGRFVDDALLAGAAYNQDGMAEAGMGVTAGDYDGDGDLDLFVTHIRGESSTLYRNDGSGAFEDVTAASGLAAASLAATGFGVLWFDFDNDGDLDLFAVNGHVTRPDAASREPFPYGQPNQLFRNDGAAGFTDVSAQAGPALRRAGVSRGAAFGDLDNDGDIDVVVNDADGPAQLLLNQAAPAARGLVVRLLTRQGRDAYGARATLRRAAAPPLLRTVGADGSYLSSGDPRPHFGLGPSEPDASVSLEVLWPDGARERFPLTESDRLLTLRQGQAVAVTRQ